MKLFLPILMLLPIAACSSVQPSSYEPSPIQPVQKQAPADVPPEPISADVSQEPVPEPAAIDEPVSPQPEQPADPVLPPEPSAVEPPPPSVEPDYVDPCAHGNGCNSGQPQLDPSKLDPTIPGTVTDPNPVTNPTMPWNWNQ